MESGYAEAEIDARLDRMKINSGSTPAKNIKAYFLGPLSAEGVYDKSRVDTFFEQVAGYEFLDFRTVSNIMDIPDTRQIFPLLAKESDYRNLVRRVEWGLNFRIYFRRSDVSYERLARKLRGQMKDYTQLDKYLAQMMAITPGSKVAESIKRCLIGDGGEVENKKVNAFVEATRGYERIDLDMLFRLLGVETEEIFSYLEKESTEDGDPIRQVTLFRGGHPYKFHFKRAGMPHEVIAERIRNIMATPVEAQNIPMDASIEVKEEKTVPDVITPVLDVKTLQGSSVGTVAKMASYEMVTLEKIMRGLDITSIEEPRNLARLLAFLNSHYVIEERWDRLKPQLGNVKKGRLYKQLENVKLGNEMPIQKLGVRGFGYVHTYRREDEPQVVQVLTELAT